MPTYEDLIKAKCQLKDDDYLMYLYSRLLNHIFFLAHTSFNALCPDIMRRDINNLYLVLLDEFERIGKILEKNLVVFEIDCPKLPKNILNATEPVIREWTKEMRGKILDYKAEIEHKLIKNDIIILNHNDVHPYIDLLERITAGAVIYFIKKAGPGLNFSKDYFIGDHLKALDKITIILSKTEGIYIYGVEKNKYKINSTVTGIRVNIINFLRNPDSISGDQLSNKLGVSAMTLLEAIKKINKNFKSKLKLEKNLILGAYNTHFYLNEDNYNLFFDD